MVVAVFMSRGEEEGGVSAVRQTTSSSSSRREQMQKTQGMGREDGRKYRIFLLPLFLILLVCVCTYSHFFFYPFLWFPEKRRRRRALVRQLPNREREKKRTVSSFLFPAQSHPIPTYSIRASEKREMGMRRRRSLFSLSASSLPILFTLLCLLKRKSCGKSETILQTTTTTTHCVVCEREREDECITVT